LRAALVPKGRHVYGSGISKCEWDGTQRNSRIS
jgi:hypothetical protein